VRSLFTFADDESSQIDSMWWFLPLFDPSPGGTSWTSKTRETAALSNDGKADTLLNLFVGDDLAGEGAQIKAVTLRVLLHDATGPYADLLRAPTAPPPEAGRIERGLIRNFANVNYLYNNSAKKGIDKRIEVRINNLLPGDPTIKDGWLVYQKVAPRHFAVGDNLVGIRVVGRAADAPAPLLVEKLEVDVDYR